MREFHQTPSRQETAKGELVNHPHNMALVKLLLGQNAITLEPVSSERQINNWPSSSYSHERNPRSDDRTIQGRHEKKKDTRQNLVELQMSNIKKEPIGPPRTESLESTKRQRNGNFPETGNNPHFVLYAGKLSWWSPTPSGWQSFLLLKEEDAV